MVYVKCDSCNGKGYLGSGACPSCQGMGKINTIPRPPTGKTKKGRGK